MIKRLFINIFSEIALISTLFFLFLQACSPESTYSDNKETGSLTSNDTEPTDYYPLPPQASEVTTWLQEKSWERHASIQAPTEILQAHIDFYADPAAHPISWILDAERLAGENNYAEAAQVLVHNSNADRSMLACQAAHMDKTAFPVLRALLREQNQQQAQELLNACTVISGAPILYLRSVVNRLTELEYKQLWGNNEPYVVLVDFGMPDSCQLNTLSNRQDRELITWDYDAETSHTDKGSLRLSLSESKRDDLFVLGWHEPFLALTPGKAGLRTWIRMKEPEPVEFVMQVQGTLLSHEPFNWLVRVPEPVSTKNGWLYFDTAYIRPDLFGALFYQYGWARSFTMHFASPDLLEKADLKISGLGFDLPSGGENTFWLERIELYLPMESWQEEARAPSPKEFSSFWLTPAPKSTPNAEDSLERLESLRALGYLGAVSAGHTREGVTLYDEEHAAPGVNFLVSGHAPELILMDMKGTPLHTWRCDFNHPAWPESELPASFMKTTFWRRAYLYPNGDVLAVLDYILLVKMDKDGRPLWVLPDKFHHNMDVTEDGTIYVLHAKSEYRPDTGYANEPLVDYIVALTPDGEEIQRISLIKALENSFYAPVLHHVNFSHDVLHTNSIKVLDGTLSDRIPAFKKGNILVCMHQPSLIAVVDTTLESVVWAQGDQWLYPHEPVLLANGTMLLFDNHGPQWNYMNRLASRILEFDPVTREVIWEYTGSRERPFHSYFCGSVAQMPNGNFLISETSAGRAFEVTKDKEIVWEYLNPHRGGENQDLIAVVFEVIRYPESYVENWLSSDL